MTNEKMEDVFECLAVVTGRDMETWELKGITGSLYAIFYGHQHCISAAKAIGSYDAQKVEVEALKAQVEILTKTVKCCDVTFKHMAHEDPSFNLDRLTCTGLIAESLTSNPNQCLDEVKAAAEKKGYWQGFETGSVRPGENINMHYREWLELKKYNADYAEKQKAVSDE